MAEISVGVVESKICELVRELLPHAPSEFSAKLRVQEDLGADSMQVIALMLSLDAEFDVDLDPAQVPDNNVTLGWVRDFVLAAHAKDAHTPL
jgi:acyl carrier protein